MKEHASIILATCLVNCFSLLILHIAIACISYIFVHLSE